MRKFLLVTTRFLTIFSSGVIIFPLLAVLRPISFAACRKTSSVFFALLMKLSGVKIRISGYIQNRNPILFVSNHSSFLDIIILGHVLPGSFISKKEVNSWPLIGWISKTIGSITLERTPQGTARSLNEIKKRLDNNHNIILFAEGTTSDGNKVLPFKSSLFKLTEFDPRLQIQPLSVTYTHINGNPITASERTDFSWVGDKTLIPSLIDLFSKKSILADIRILPPVENYSDRKELARLCHMAVVQGVNYSLQNGKNPIEHGA